MGSCLSTSDPSTPLKKKQRKNGGKRKEEELELDALHRIPGRMHSNGASGAASIYTQLGKKGTNQDAMIVWQALTASGSRKNGLVFGEIQSQLKNKNITVDVKANSDNNLLTTITADDLATPGLKSIISFVVPDQNSGKVELQYLHEYAGVNASIGLTANPVVNLSGVFGTNKCCVGADVSLDTATGNFTKHNAALCITNADLVTSLALNNKGENLTASYYHLISPLRATAVGAELSHSFSTNENTITFGTQHALDPLTMVKARLNNYGKATALIQHQFRPKSFLTISGEVDTRAIEKDAKVGLSFILKP